jgi:hypothetical protein
MAVSSEVQVVVVGRQLVPVTLSYFGPVLAGGSVWMGLAHRHRFAGAV